MNVSLPPELEKLVAECLKSGEYNSASEVVRQALRLLQVEQQLHNAKVKRLKAGLAKGQSDLRAGRFTEISSERELKAFFKRL